MYVSLENIEIRLSCPPSVVKMVRLLEMVDSTIIQGFHMQVDDVNRCYREAYDNVRFPLHAGAALQGESYCRCRSGTPLADVESGHAEI